MALDVDIKTAVERIAQDVDSMREALEKIAGTGFGTPDQTRRAAQRESGVDSLLEGASERTQRSSRDVTQDIASLTTDLSDALQKYTAAGTQGLDAFLNDVQARLEKGDDGFSGALGGALGDTFKNLSDYAGKIIPELGGKSGKEFIEGLQGKIKGDTETGELVASLLRDSVGYNISKVGMDALNTQALESSNQIRKTFGGILGDTSTLSNRTAASINRSLNEFRDEAVKTNLAGGRSLAMISENIEATYQNRVLPVLNDSRLVLSLGDQIAQGYGGRITKEIGIAAEGLGIGTEQIKSFIERNQALTGKANTDMLLASTAAAQGAGEALGLAAKNLMPIMAEVIGSVERFGNVGPAAAAKISAQVVRLGVDFRSLDSIVSKMQGFDSASESVGKLTAAFGVNLDAMELMYLANEDQANLLPYLRDRFEEAGVDIATSSNAMKRVLSEALGGVGVQNVEKILGDLGGNFEESQNQVASSIDTALKDTLESFKKATADIASVAGDPLARILAQIDADITAKISPSLTKALGFASEESVKTAAVAFSKLEPNYKTVIDKLVVMSEALGRSLEESVLKNIKETARAVEAASKPGTSAQARAALPPKEEPAVTAAPPATESVTPAAAPASVETAKPTPPPAAPAVTPAPAQAPVTTEATRAAAQEAALAAATPAVSPQPINANINIYIDITEDMQRIVKRTAIIVPEGATISA